MILASPGRDLGPVAGGVGGDRDPRVPRHGDQRRRLAELLVDQHDRVGALPLAVARVELLLLLRGQALAAVGAHEEPDGAVVSARSGPGRAPRSCSASVAAWTHRHDQPDQVGGQATPGRARSASAATPAPLGRRFRRPRDRGPGRRGGRLLDRRRRCGCGRPSGEPVRHRADDGHRRRPGTRHRRCHRHPRPPERSPGAVGQTSVESRAGHRPMMRTRGPSRSMTLAMLHGRSRGPAPRRPGGCRSPRPGWSASIRWGGAWPPPPPDQEVP